MCIYINRQKSGGTYTNDRYRKPFGAEYKVEYDAKCGHCWQCMKEKANKWVVRTTLEYRHMSRLGYKTYFGTLTLKNEEGKESYSRTLQLFIKRLRKNTGEKGIRYVAVKEYGTKKGRLHWHIILWIKTDLKLKYYKTNGRAKMYTSNIINKAWQQGIATMTPLESEQEAVVKYISLYSSPNKQGYKQALRAFNGNKEKTKLWWNEFREKITSSQSIGWEEFITNKRDSMVTGKIWILDKQYTIPQRWIEKAAYAGIKQAQDRIDEQMANELDPIEYKKIKINKDNSRQQAKEQRKKANKITRSRQLL